MVGSVSLDTSPQHPHAGAAAAEEMTLTTEAITLLAQDVIASLVETMPTALPLQKERKAPIYSQVIHNLEQYTPSLEDFESVIGTAYQILSLSQDVQQLALAEGLKTAGDLYSYSHHLQEQLRATGDLPTIDNPGKGNCFLWSCVIALDRMLGHNSPPKELGPEQERLRAQITDKFLELISNPQEKELRERFLDYVTHNRVLKDHLPQLDELERALFIAEGLSAPYFLERQDSCRKIHSLLSTYVDLISKDGTWNGEFEAELVAQIIRRPIVIISGDGALYPTIAGSEYFDHAINPALVLIHQSNHYKTVVT
jgi:hypothetical protein